jgi:hypothetical protein
MPTARRPATERKRRNRRSALWLLAIGMLMCSSPQSSGESHVGTLLLECSGSSACGAGRIAGLDCFCSFCTLPCADVSACRAELGDVIPLEKLRCRHPVCLGATTGDGEGPGVCDVSCASDAECASYATDLICSGGFCRRASVSGNAKSSCPAGTTFMRGSTDGRVLDLCIDVQEVTVEQYDSCVAEAACAAPAQGNYYVADRGAHPINFVTPDEARAYCAHVAKALPSLEQWTWVAENGRVSTTYPWGDDPPSASDNPARVCALGAGSTCEVGSFPAGNASGGIADLVGNVAELVENGDGVCASGGSYLAATEADILSCVEFAEPAAHIGFRCVAAPN